MYDKLNLNFGPIHLFSDHETRLRMAARASMRYINNKTT